MAQNPITVPAKRLSVSITAAGASFQLNNIKGWNGEDLTAADFGDRAYAVFLNEDRTIMEIMRFDPATIASASITIVKRGLDFKGGDSEVTANKLSWTANETIVLIGTNPPQLFEEYVDKYSDETIAGEKTFLEVPKSSADPVAGDDLTRLSYVQALVLGTLTTINVIVPGKAGETVAAGNLIYFDETDNEWKKCDADTASTVDNVLLGIAQGAGTDGNVIANGILLQGIDDNQSGLTEGDVYYASNTAGGISNTPGTTEVTVGIARSTTELYFAPRFNQVLTENQQDALNSTTTPSASNKYMTQADFQKAVEVYGADSVGTDSYAITPTPAVSAYTAGMRFMVKLGAANTGAATLAVGTGGAKAIKKNYNSDVVTGDLLSGMIIEVAYDAANDCWQLVSPTATPLSFKAVTATRDNTVADGTQQIAHGLGKIPLRLRITATLAQGTTTGATCMSFGSYDGTNQKCVYFTIERSGGQFVSTPAAGVQNVGIYIAEANDLDPRNVGTVSFDATNVEIAWVKTGSPAGITNLLIEVEG